MGKRYYWLKLKEDFFDSKRIKKLRRLAGGDTFTIIYLKMQLKAMKSDGYLQFDGLEKTFAEELALDIDEEPENVQVTLSYLISCGLIETSDDLTFFLPFSVENTGSEGSSTKRVREYRAREKLGAPPTLEEVAAYCKERGTSIDPQKWFDHYTSNGWMVGRTKMKDWKAAVRTWEKNDVDKQSKNSMPCTGDYDRDDEDINKYISW